jgi:hypothetical protein
VGEGFRLLFLADVRKKNECHCMVAVGNNKIESNRIESNRTEPNRTEPKSKMKIQPRQPSAECHYILSLALAGV